MKTALKSSAMLLLICKTNAKEITKQICCDARKPGTKKKMDCTICVGKTKALITCAITALTVTGPVGVGETNNWCLMCVPLTI